MSGNMGDFITRLICDASQYTSGANSAIGANKALGGSIDSITGQLERQRRELQNSRNTTHQNILNTATKGATEGQVNNALQLQAEVEALRKKHKAEEDATAAMLRGKAAGDQLVTSLEHQKATLGMTSQQLAIYKAQQAGASATDIARAKALQSEILALSAAKEAQQNLVMQSGRNMAVNTGFSRNSMVLTESMRGLEDAVAGYTNNGLKGMLMATTNNMNQIGSLTGGMAGMALSIGSVGALIGVSLLPKLYDWATNTREVEEANERLIKSNKHLRESFIETWEGRRDAKEERRQMDANFRNKPIGEMGSKQIQGELDALQQQSQNAFTERQAAKDKQHFMRQDDPRVAKPVREFKELPDRDWGGWAGEMTGGKSGQETKAQRDARRKAHEELTEKREQFEKLLQLEKAATDKLDVFAKQRAELQKRLREEQKRDVLRGRGDRILSDQEDNERESKDWLQEAGKHDKEAKKQRDLDGKQRERESRDDGRTGFASADIKTTEGANNAQKAINYSNAFFKGGKAEEMAELKMIADNTEKTVRVTEALTDAILRNTPTIVDFA